MDVPTIVISPPGPQREFRAKVYRPGGGKKWNWDLDGAAGFMTGPGFSGEGAEEAAWTSLLSRIKDVYATNKKEGEHHVS